ncbi:MAG: phosphatidate cytidylyltransferase [Calditrichaeota bacterium]|nr:MAG: phosphatidate cytidylyltransferase [Calditrichota bacterium]MBL1204139.1 phosphatidate cytidylyltransferase [Calditrichota bacterium]NOG43970.1 phosphatidate cytidylyltransferase [Calditrichota bacterium]
MQNEISPKTELARKFIHISTSIIPLVYYYMATKEQILVLCISLFLIFLVGDVLRIYVTKLRQIYEKVFGMLLRKNETGKTLNGATLLFLGFLLAVVLFEKNIAVVSMLFLSVSDTLAAVAGKLFGKYKIFNKTIEGTAAFFLSAFIISLFFYDKPILGFGVALATAIIELVPLKINDNITIPLISGLLFTIAKI